MNLEEVYERGEILGDSPDRLAHTVWGMHHVSKNISSPHRNSGTPPANCLRLNTLSLF